MGSALWGFIGTLVGAVVGASASILTTHISGRNSARLQEKEDTLQRLERAREFQRKNLLELQDSLLLHMRLIARAHLEDVKSFKEVDNNNKSNLLSTELNQELMVSNRKLTIITERIADDTLRDNLKELRNKMSDVVLKAKSVFESERMIQIASTRFEQFMVQLGVVLRSTY